MLDAYIELTEYIGRDAGRSVCIVEHFNRTAVNAVPRDATAYNNRGDWFNATIGPCWRNPELDNYVRDWVHKLVDKLGAIERADDQIKDGDETVGKRAYFNGGSLNDVKSALVFGKKYRRLRELKRKYDPDLVFNKWYPIIPANL